MDNRHLDLLSSVESKAKTRATDAYKTYDALNDFRVIAQYNPGLLEDEIDLILYDVRRVFDTMPGDKAWLEQDPYWSIDTEETEDDYVTAYLRLSIYPYVRVVDEPATYEWLVENCSSADDCNLSYDAKHLSSKFTFQRSRVRLFVSITCRVSDEDEWMLRSLGKIRTVEQPARVEQALVCG